MMTWWLTLAILAVSGMTHATDCKPGFTGADCSDRVCASTAIGSATEQAKHDSSRRQLVADVGNTVTVRGRITEVKFWAGSSGGQEWKAGGSKLVLMVLRPDDPANPCAGVTMVRNLASVTVEEQGEYTIPITTSPRLKVGDMLGFNFFSYGIPSYAQSDGGSYCGANLHYNTEPQPWALADLTDRVYSVQFSYSPDECPDN